VISLNAAQIINNINDYNLKNKIDLHVFREIDSTNSFLKTLNSKNYLSVCCAEQQTQGRGRHGRDWYSPYGENIYLSLRWEIHKSNRNIEQLSIIAGLSIIEVLKTIGIKSDIYIKWPNDIYYKNKKLAGILTEIIHNTDNLLNVIVGIGINVNSNFKNSNSSANNWASLISISEKIYDRNIIIAKLIENIQANLIILLKSGFEKFAAKWKEYDYLYGKNISVTNISQKIQGIAKGISLNGELLLLTENNQIFSLKSGEATLAQMEIPRI